VGLTIWRLPYQVHNMARTAAFVLAGLAQPAAGLSSLALFAPNAYVQQNATPFLERPIVRQEWNLVNTLTRAPQKLLAPVSKAVSLSYSGTNGYELIKDDASLAFLPEAHSGGAFWDRFPLGEIDPTFGGLHAIVFKDDKSKRMIISFRGVSMNPKVGDTNRDMDYCVDAKLRHEMPEPELECERFSEESMDYLGQAEEVVGRVKMQMPIYNILLTGHGLGGKIAILTSIKIPSTKALAFGIDSVNQNIKEKLHLSQAAIDDLPADKYVVVSNPCDPYYLKAKSSKTGFAGLTSCTVHGLDEVDGCADCKLKLGDMKEQSCGLSLQAHHHRKYMEVLNTASKHTTIQCSGGDAVLPA